MQYDITIIGSGIVGATLACLLSKHPLKIALIDKRTPTAWSDQFYDTRVSAITHASQQLFADIGVWSTIIAKRVSPFRTMQVWDAAGSGAIQFNCTELGKQYLGHIIENGVIHSALIDAIKQRDNIELITPIELTAINKNDDVVTLTTADNKTLTSQLIVGADGAHSWLRQQAGIELRHYDYQHTALVTTVTTEQPHQATAWQRFMAQGPLALLPLADPTHCSIVWSTLPEHAQHLLALKEEQFNRELSMAFEHRLGNITKVDKLHSFPLHMRHAKHYVQPRLALAGDAAHTIHPLAGQGVNLGLLDAAKLAEVINTAITKNRDYTNLHTLRKYERARKGHNHAAIAVMEGFKRLFANQSLPVILARNWGLTFTDHTRLLKRLIMQLV